MNSLPCFLKLLLAEGTFNQMNNSQTSLNFGSFKSTSCLEGNVGENE